MGDYIYKIHADGTIVVNLATVQLEHARNFILNFKNLAEIGDDVPIMEYWLSYKIGGGVYTSEPISVSKASIPDDSSSLEITHSHMARYTAVEQIRKAIKLKNEGRPAAECLNIILEFIISHKLENVPSVVKLMETLNDQIKLALSDDPNNSSMHNGRLTTFFKKWGEFYCDQLSRSLNLEQCCNFKDAAVQVFGGDKFKEM